MGTFSAIANLPRPSLTDLPNGPTAFNSLTDALDKLVIPRFANVTARNAAIPSPVSGQHAYLDDNDTLTVYSDLYGRWLQYAHGGTGTKALAYAESKVLNTSSQALTTTATDVANCTITFTTIKPQALLKMDFVGDFETTATSVTGRMWVVLDGTAQVPNAYFSGSNTAAGARATVGNGLWVNVAAAGTHTCKLQTAMVTGASGIRLFGSNTTLSVSVYE